MRDAKTSSSSVSDLKKHIGFWLRFVSNHVSQAFARKLQASGVTVAEWVVNLGAFPTIVILRLRNMTALDATGLHALEVLAGRLRRTGRTLLLCGARDQPAELLARADFVDEMGRRNILPNVQAALDRAREIGASFSGVGPEIAHDMLRMKI